MDLLIKTDFTSFEKYKLIAFFSFIVAINTTLGYLDISTGYNIIGDRIGLMEVLLRYLGLDFVAYTSNLIEYSNKILINGLERRLKQLNTLLKHEYIHLSGNNFEMCKKIKKDIVQGNLLIPAFYKRSRYEVLVFVKKISFLLFSCCN